MLQQFRTAVVALGALGAISGFIAPAAAQNWESNPQLRFGLFVQGGRGTIEASSATATGSAPIQPKGFGVTAGAELLRAVGWSFGVEGDFGQSVAGTTTASLVGATYATDFFGSARGRVGYYLAPRAMVYGTAGMGFRGVSVTDPFGSRAQRTLESLAYGGGAEWHLDHTILFAEYLHDVERSLPMSTATSNYRIGGATDAVRLGVKFKLGSDPYDDDVARRIGRRY